MNYGNGNYGYGQYPSYANGQSYSQGQQANVENTFAWVYGDAGAEAFAVAPGRTVLLMHYSEPILYVKSTDINGRPLPMEVYELVRRNGGYSQAQQQIPMQPQVNMNEYVKNSELESKVNEIMNRTMNNSSMNNQRSMQGQASYQQMPNNQNWNHEVQ